MNRNKLFSIIKIGILVIIPIVLLLLPANQFDNRASICISVILFDTECFGCGMARACMHLIHGNFFEAYQYNMLSFVAFPALAFQWAKWGLKECRILNLIKTNKKAKEFQPH